MPAIPTASGARNPYQQGCLFDPICFLKQVEALHGQFQFLVYSSFIAALLVASIIMKLSPGPAGTDWLMLFSLVTGLRIYFGLVRNNHRFNLITACEWYGTFLIGSFIAGALWCYLGLGVIAGLNLQAIDLIYLHAVNVLVISSLTAGALYACRTSLLGVLAFSLPAVVPYALYLAAQEEFYLPTLGTLFLIYYLFLLVLALGQCHQPARDTRAAA